jgi:hypothetical protein
MFAYYEICSYPYTEFYMLSRSYSQVITIEQTRNQTEGFRVTIFTFYSSLWNERLEPTSSKLLSPYSEPMK